MSNSKKYEKTPRDLISDKSLGISNYSFAKKFLYYERPQHRVVIAKHFAIGF